MTRMINAHYHVSGQSLASQYPAGMCCFLPIKTVNILLNQKRHHVKSLQMIILLTISILIFERL